MNTTPHQSVSLISENSFVKNAKTCCPTKYKECYRRHNSNDHKLFFCNLCPHGADWVTSYRQ